ncbi:hypothetical protein BDR22DRAFT_974917 [Usnea florida]
MSSGRMAAFQQREVKASMTCRHWLLDPAGCLDNQCSYSHTITSLLSPPSMFLCYAFNNGGCPRSQDQCLFTHLISGPYNRYLQIRHPEMMPSDAPIAEAAARAGFDCSNWSKLKSLIDAVRNANKPVSYPDRWTGPAAFQSDTYPDRWRAEDTRIRKGPSQAYRGFGKTPSVPAFVVPAGQLIDNAKSISRAQNSARPPAAGIENAPLRPRVSNKRSSDVIGALSSSTKRAKIEPYSIPNIVDLTQEDEHDSRSIPSRRPRPQPALTDHTANRNSRKKSQRRRKTARSWREPDVYRESLGTLAKIASKLRASVHAIAVDRETLRQRWEIDEHLQLQHITDNLVDLNDCFTSAEEGINGALDVIEKRLL